MLSTMDDYPLHQIADVIRHTGTSDRNFYDRYYFNMHNAGDELFVVFGLGQYPNLGVQDAFLLVRHKDKHHVIRASRPLSDRGDISVGPLRIEVIEGLQRLRIVCDDAEHGITMNATWQGEHFPFLEPRHYIRKEGRVLFDTMRFAQLGRWQGELAVDGQHFAITPEDFIGSRDRSWGVRPVGEAEPAGIHAGTPSMEGMWNYFPVLFDDFALLYIINETEGGQRSIEEAMRVWKAPSREPEWLGRPEHEHRFNVAQPFLADIAEGVVHFPDAPGGALTLRGRPTKLQTYLTTGTGYGLEPDWRHGMYQGPETVVQRETLDYTQDQGRMLGLVEVPSTFTLSGPDGEQQGAGMMEFGFWSSLSRYTG